MKELVTDERARKKLVIIVIAVNEIAIKELVIIVINDTAI